MISHLSKTGFANLTPEKYDICILIDVVNSAGMARYPQNPRSNLNEKDFGHDVAYTSSIF